MPQVSALASVFAGRRGLGLGQAATDGRQKPVRSSARQAARQLSGPLSREIASVLLRGPSASTPDGIPIAIHIFIPSVHEDDTEER